MWKRTGAKTAFFGGGQLWALIPMAFNPNPSRCVWKGPKLWNLNCSTCALGYEAASNGTCIQPSFRPHNGWKGSPDQARLQLKGSAPISASNQSNDPTRFAVFANRTYTIPAPNLEPKESKFVGYAQPFLKIR